MVRAAAIALIVGAVVVAMTGGAVAGPPIIGLKDRHFDHDRHASSAQAGGRPAACASCHTIDRQGAMKLGREHDRCASCHQFAASCSVMQTPGPKGPARMCAVCHVPTRPDCLPRDLPASPKQDSFTSRFTHGKHFALGTSIERGCAQCHPSQAGAPPPPQAHRPCAGCHNPDGAKPAISECASCHVALTGRSTSAGQAIDPYRLNGFDHRNHVAKSQQSSCLGCHDRLVGSGEAALLRPAMVGCLTKCHDSMKAFSATATRCTTCHKGATAEQPAPMPTDLGFSHAQHAARSVKIADCGGCHTLLANGTLAAPGANKDHMPCATSGCHQTEFTVRTPKICGVCHDAAVPWRKAVARAKAPIHLEWSKSMNHAAHLARISTGTSNATCATCHGDKLAGAAAPKGHAACAQCHNRGERPAMTECAMCHARSTPAAARVASPWSVASTFEHTKHAHDPRTRTPTACVECHTQAQAAKELAALSTPKMANCDGCHDGKSSFKTTGFDCARCHAPRAQPTAARLAPEPARRTGSTTVGDFDRFATGERGR